MFVWFQFTFNEISRKGSSSTIKKNHLYLLPLRNIPDKNLFYNNILPLELLSSLFFSDVKRFFQSSMTRIKLIIMYNLLLTSQKYDLKEPHQKQHFKETDFTCSLLRV